jgi:hypothetical protein
MSTQERLTRCGGRELSLSVMSMQGSTTLSLSLWKESRMSFELKQLILDRFSLLELVEILDLDPEEFYDRFEDIILERLDKLKEIDNGLEKEKFSEENS